MILVATDGSCEALAAMRTALELAAHGGDRLAVVSCWQELHATLGFPVDVEIERDWARDGANKTSALAEEVGLEPEVSIRHGSPGREICAAAREVDARLIVMGCSGLGTVAGALLGSVSAYVLQHASCSVLVVRTDSGRMDRKRADRRTASSAV
jgi:nucleotide-binding universal stress UspA family protein